MGKTKNWTWQGNLSVLAISVFLLPLAAQAEETAQSETPVSHDSTSQSRPITAMGGSLTPNGSTVDPMKGLIRTFEGDLGPHVGRIRTFEGDVDPQKGLIRNKYPYAL